MRNLEYLVPEDEPEGMRPLWGTVQAGGLVLLDGDTEPLPVSTASLVRLPVVGARVAVDRHGKGLRVMGTLGGSKVDAEDVVSGTFQNGLIPALPASQVTSGVFDPARIPVKSITVGDVTGNWPLNRTTGNLPVGNVSGNWPLGNTSGRLPPGRLPPDISAGDITATNDLSSFGPIWGHLAQVTDSANVAIGTGFSQLQRGSSSRRYKIEIQDAPALPALLDVQPRTWEGNPETSGDPTGKRIFGAIAEELDDLGLTHLVEYNDDGSCESIKYDRIAIALIPEVRKLRDTVADLVARVEALE